MYDITKDIDGILQNNLHIDSNSQLFISITDCFEINIDSRKNLIIGNFSIKPWNIKLNLNKLLLLILDNCQSFVNLSNTTKEMYSINLILNIIKDLVVLISSISVKIDESMKEIIKYLVNNNGFAGINMQLLKDALSESIDERQINEALNKLSQLKTIKLDNNIVILNESIIL